MGNEDFGENSRKSSDEDDEIRPFKKAKYVWQVKGKYHLKTSTENESSNSSSCSSTSSNSSSNNNNDNNKESLQQQQQQRPKSCKGHCVNNLLARTEAILEKTEGLLDSDEEDPTKNIDRAIFSEIPITLVSPDPKNHDYYLRKWQARHIARGYIDNTINSVLETSVSPPFDPEDFLDNCDGDGQIEDEGILMAIQSHGLQSTTLIKKEQPSLAFLKPDELVDSTLDKFEERFGWDLMENSNRQVNESDANLMKPVDILNAAILVAIERKGLSSA